MKIKLVSGATTFEAAINTIKQIDMLDLEMQNMVVVPDAFSMQAENLIFDTLKIKSTFNIEVVGISRLASKILHSENIPFKRISGLEEVFCIFKACTECFSQFTYFKTCNVDLCVKLLQIVKQFKACKILPEKIKPVGDEMLDSKMHDLKLIYEKYESLLEDKLDLSKLLQFFLEKTENDLNLKKTNLYFVNFDSFTVEINDFICRLATRVNKIFIGMAKPISQKNAYIYEDDIFRKTTALAKKYDVVIEAQTFPTALANESLEIVENLFAYEIEKKPNENFFLNVVAKNTEDEVEFVAKYIKNQIANGHKFKEFAVAVSNEKYFEQIKTVFTKYQISANMDNAVDLSQTVVAHFVLKMLQVAKIGFNLQAFQYIACSPLLNADEKVLHDIFYFQVADEKEFLERFPQYANVLNILSMLANANKMSEFISAVISLLDLIKINYENFVGLMQEESMYKKQSENAQALPLLLEVLEKLNDLGKDEKIGIIDFENILTLALKSVKVETIPSYIDAVFVGDATDSYFEDVCTLFVLGATAQALPRTKSDVGLIDDDDIRKLRINYALEPEIKVINRRNRLKLFELLQHAKKQLIVLLPQTCDGHESEKADFLKGLLALFGNKVVHTSAFENFDLGLFSSSENLNRLLFFLGNKQNFMEAYCKLKSQNKLPKQFESDLSSIINFQIPHNQQVECVDSKFLFPNQTISASKLECFFSCPFKYLLQYGLNLNEKENILPNKKKFGNFEHSLLKLFVQTFQDQVGKVSSSQIQQFLDEFLLAEAQKFYDNKILKNLHFVSFLKNESKIILKNVVKEQKNSDFHPILLEEKVFVPFAQNINLVGTVDRVDVCGKYFRIIDYKTGKRFSVKNELYYGNKLQLFLYAQAIEKKLGLEIAGLYYFDCQTKYEKHGQQHNLFNGQTLKDNKVVEMMDWRVSEGVKSDVLGMVLKKNVEQGEFAYYYGNAVDNFKPQLEYAKKLCENAILEMKEGFAQAKPFVGACNACPYIAICKHLPANGVRKPYKTKKENDNEN